MIVPENKAGLARESDFEIADLLVSPSSCRVRAGEREARVEPQTMSLLLILWRAHGATVSKDELITACWQGRIVSDEAVTRAIARVRALARLSATPAFDLEAVSKVGYRLLPHAADPHAYPKEAANLQESMVNQQARLDFEAPRRHMLVAAITLALGAALFIAPRTGQSMPGTVAASQSHVALINAVFGQSIKSTDVVDALLNADEPRLRAYIQGGWDPNWHLDSESNAALHTLMLACERNPSHDKSAIVSVARLLIENGADTRAKNGWGDTPLSIAQSLRYCGPTHPVVAFLKSYRTR